MFTRMNIPNHPSNTMLLCKRWETDFDDFNIMVDVIRSQLITSELQSFSNRANINHYHILLAHYGLNHEFPHPPIDPVSRPAPIGIPSISHLSLFLHARSCLLATCTTDGYTKNEGAETTRSRHCEDEEPEFFWDYDLGEGGMDIQGDEDEWGAALRFTDEMDDGLNGSVLDSADSGNLESPVEDPLTDFDRSDELTASWVSKLQDETLAEPGEL